MKISEAFALYGKYMVINGQAKRTIETHYYVGRRLVEVVGDKKINKLTLDDISKWHNIMNYRIKNNRTVMKRTPNSLRADILRLRAVLKHLKLIGVKCMDYELVPIPKREPIPRCFLSEDEVSSLIEHAYSLRNQCIISLLYSSGVRLSEMLSLNRNSIHERRFTVVGKGHKERLCFIDERTDELINEYLTQRTDDCQALFVSELYEKRMSSANVQLIIRNASKRARLNKHVTPHILRHSFATNFVHNNGEIRTLSVLLGHSNLDTTAIYTHVVDNELESKYKKYHTF